MSAQRPPRPAGVRPPPPRPAGSASAASSTSAQNPAGSSRAGNAPSLARPPVRPPPQAASLLRRSTPGEARSILPSRSPSVRPPGASRSTSIGFRPVRPPPRRIQVKEDPDAPSTAAGSTAGSPGPSTFSRPRPRPRGGPVMTASGPFARGTEATNMRGGGRATASNISSIGAPQASSTTASTNAASSSSKPGQAKGKAAERRPRSSSDADLEYREDYSDPEEDGYEIIDEYDVSSLDTFAPRALPRETIQRNRREKDIVKKEEPVDTDTPMTSPAPAAEGEQKTSDALDLDASEDEEVMDDLLEYFVDMQEDGKGDPENKLLLFQFPPIFPRFSKPAGEALDETAPTRNAMEEDGERRVKARRSVAFADDTAGGGGNAGESPRTTPGPNTVKEDTKPVITPKKRRGSASSNESRPDVSSAEDTPRKSSRASSSKKASSSTHEGQIGRLDVFRDGRVVFRFGTDMHLVMDVTGGSQTSFLQHAVHVDESTQRATTLGELHRKFVVAPEIASMLADALDNAETNDTDEHDPEGMERLPSRSAL